MADKSNYLVHYKNATGSNSLQVKATVIREFTNIDMISTNSSYGALSNYAFIFNNLGQVPVFYLKI